MSTFLFAALATLQAVQAQEKLELRPSPLAMVTSRYEDTYVKITYSQPQKKGRQIFGSLVPFGEVWRTGANEATELTITQDVKLADTLLKAGTYSLFTIPYQDHWTIILNSELGLWGAYNYSAKQDVLRFDVPVTPLADIVYEPFTIAITPRNDKADISFMWDRSKVTFTIQYFQPKHTP